MAFTRCGLVMSYGDIYLGQQYIGSVLSQHWTNVDLPLKVCYGI